MKYKKRKKSLSQVIMEDATEVITKLEGKREGAASAALPHMQLRVGLWNLMFGLMI